MYECDLLDCMDKLSYKEGDLQSKSRLILGCTRPVSQNTAVKHKEESPELKDLTSTFRLSKVQPSLSKTSVMGVSILMLLRLLCVCLHVTSHAFQISSMYVSTT